MYVFSLEFVVVVFAFLFVDLFDTLGTLIGVSTKAGMLDKDGKLPRIKGALMADAWHHRSDALSSIGAFVGIFGARLGYPILDPVASIVSCFMIAKAAIDIFRDAIDKMVAHSCDAKTEESMRREILKVPGVRRVDLLRTRLFGSKMYVDIEIAAAGEISLNDAHDIAENVHHTIVDKFKDVKHCMVHVNPING